MSQPLVRLAPAVPVELVPVELVQQVNTKVNTKGLFYWKVRLRCEMCCNSVKRH